MANPQLRDMPPSSAEILHRMIEEFQNVVFDLDGTLYDTRDFERPALAAVAEWVAQRSGRNLDGLKESLWARREIDRHKPGLFDDCLTQFGLPSSWGPECLRVFHTGSTRVLRDADSLKGCLITLKNAGRRLALVSNGVHSLQKDKLADLGMSDLFEQTVVCTPDRPEFQKPSAWAWEELAEWRGRASTVYVGDDPVDREFAVAGSAKFADFKFRSSRHGN